VLVALTGYGQKADRDPSFASGFDHHFVKPVTVAYPVDVINAAPARISGRDD
jgi:hypothetical protein